jgi:acyl-CoA reductase-like NAD-dependent aldehyde dehydrogenase
VFEKVRAMMAERYRALRVGPAALDLDVGPVISQRQKVVIEHYLGSPATTASPSPARAASSTARRAAATTCGRR